MTIRNIFTRGLSPCVGRTRNSSWLTHGSHFVALQMTLSSHGHNGLPDRYIRLIDQPRGPVEISGISAELTPHHGLRRKRDQAPRSCMHERRGPVT